MGSFDLPRPHRTFSSEFYKQSNLTDFHRQIPPPLGPGPQKCYFVDS